MNQPRKQLSRLVFTLAAALLVGIGLAACGGGGLSGSSNEDVPTAKGGEPTGKTFVISSWPLYIDDSTIKNFQKETGIKTVYNEDVNDNNQFFGKVQSQLSQGNSGGRSIMVVTDWMAEKMWKLGYLQRLDHNYLKTTFKNMIPALQHPAYDPDREFTVPWQSGMTGLMVREDLAPEIKSINDLFDPKYKGKVTMLEEMRDTVPLVMSAEGIDPKDATTEDWMNAIDKLREGVDSGQIRRFTGNDFVQDMIKGDVVAAIGWSGDGAQVVEDNPNIQYVPPAEGCSLWSDNMVIPVGAPNSPAAYEYMNYVYEPKNMVPITTYVNYTPPVQGIKELLAAKDPKLAENPLVFPPDKWLDKCFSQVSPPGDEAEQQKVEQAFQDVVNG